MSKTLSDLPTDLHRLILSHDEEKIELKKENEKLKTRVSQTRFNWFLMCEARIAELEKENEKLSGKYSDLWHYGCNDDLSEVNIVEMLL